MKHYSTLFFFVMLAISCSDDNTTPTPTPTLVREWTIPLSATYENPAPANRTETGSAKLQLMSDNSLKYTLTVTGLASGDALTASHLHVGNVITNGNVIQDLNPTFTNGTATGTITNLRSSLIDSLQSDNNDIYINIHSTQFGGGLVRGQLNRNVEFAKDLVLTSANEVPAGTSAATGLALIRLASDRQLYTKITVTGLEAGDALAAAHYHKAAAGVNGPIALDIYSSAADFGTVKVSAVDEVFIAALKNDPMYVNVHSTSKPGGLIRAQIR